MENKIRHLRQYLRGWAKNLSCFYKKEKERLTLLIDELDLKAKTIPLSVAESAAKKEADECLDKFHCQEESKWAQQAKVKHIQEGGNNMKYFHSIPNGKHRKKHIF
jgi:GH35 family endo-1,4-beta-xylanase